MTVRTLRRSTIPVVALIALSLVPGCRTGVGDAAGDHGANGTGARTAAPSAGLYGQVAARLAAAGEPDAHEVRPGFVDSLVLPDADLDLGNGIVSAAWYGFTGIDDTRSLTAAINSGADIILIPAMEVPWQTGPLEVSVQQPLTIVFEPGAVVEAIEGGYTDIRDRLLTIHDRNDIRIVGYGAEIRMRKDDYHRPAYEPSQWRHALAITGSERVTVEGLTITASGGDGVYLGVSRPWRRPVRDVVLRDLTIRDNHRQGISVIAAVGLLIENVTISGTHGHLPAAGIDFEPNQPTEHLRRIVVRNAHIYDNRGAAVLVALRQYLPWSFPVDITFENVTAVGNPIAFWSAIPNDVRGSIDVEGVEAFGITRWPKISSP